MVSRNDLENIKKAVADELARDTRIDATDIKVRVSDDAVILQGTVPYEFTRRAALQRIDAFCGGREVQDELVVRFPATSTTPSGEELRSAIESLLGWVPGLNVRSPAVRLEAGAIVVEGRVDEPAMKERVAEAIREHFGVVELENRLAVTPDAESRP